MAQTNNEFYEGYDKDTDNLKKKNTVLSEALNLRLVNVEGQGFVVTNVEGNEQWFNISPFFIPLGRCEYNGVSYIFSFNPITNEGEVGTYPSPDCNGNFLPVYQPLQNFTGPINPILNPNAPRLPFRTSKFDFDCEHQIECFARIDFDNSLNIYFTDYKNPIRSINTGFTLDGFCTNRLYWDGSFPNGIELINETCGHPVSSLVSISQGGALQAGNYIFFIRYNTIDFNPTSFLGESNACQISPDNSGAGWYTQGAQGLTLTNKKVTLTLSNLDVNFPYVEVAFAYFHEGTFTTGLIDELFDINGSSTITIDLTGKEDLIDITLEEIIRRKSSCDIVKSITHMENRFWGGNVKCRNLFHQDLVDFAKCILPEADNSLRYDDQYAQTGQSELLLGQHKDYYKTYNNVGYFRTESYALGVVFVFNSGRESEVFPMSGYDAFLDPLAATINDQGIFRFPHTQQLPHIINDVVNSYKFKLAIAGLKFKFIPPGCTPTQWMLDNICGFYFVRGERKENLVKQGVVMNTYNTVCRPGGQVNCLINNDTEDYVLADRGVVVPLLFGDGINNNSSNCPTSGGVYPATDIDATSLGPASECYRLAIANRLQDGKYAFLSTDHFLTQEHSNGRYYVQGIGRMVYNGNISYGGDFNAGFALPAGIVDCLRYSQALAQATVFQVDTNAIGPWQSIDINGFVSYVPEKDFAYFKRDCAIGYGEAFNRTFGTPRYIGITGGSNNYQSDLYLGPLLPTFPGGVPTGQGINMWYLNMYKVDPINGWTNATLLAQYNVKNTVYHKISDFIPLSNYANYINNNPNRPVFYKGDCFLQRTYHKILYNPDVYNTTDVDNCQNTKKTFGIVASVITENNVNSAMRHDIGGSNEYYPRTGLFNGTSGPENFVINNNKYEAEVYNEGYNQTLSLFGINGYDKDIPASARQRRYPTRIIYSDQHVLNSLSDGYKKIGVAQFRDFDYRLGEINKIIDLNLRLISIQDSGINLHFINEKAVVPSGGTSPELVLGTGDVLSQKTQPLADQLGSQHQWSVCKSDYYIYGVDWFKRKIWRMNPNSGVEIISVTKRIDTEVYNIIEQYGHISDITEKLPDNPVCKEGITSIYDRKFADIIVCFTFDQNREDPVDNYTLKFNEKINAFTGRYSLNTAMFVSINEDLYSFNSAVFPSQGNASGAGDAWLEGRHFDVNNNSIKTTVFGVLKQTILGWVVNLYSDQAKVFDQHDLVSGPENPESISYDTQHQSAIQNPFITGIALKQLNPRYLENAWRVPIMRTQVITNPTNNIYSPGSRLRGMYLKTILTYLTNSGIFVKSVLTKIRPSKQ